ncbi:MAG: hypothetical protein EXR33_12070 [Betaproteobacteria bacterium]|nr:hypothetical protein [Betaproteobacteria bacterium]
MTIKGQVCIAGGFEHPMRKGLEKSIAQLHAEVAKVALADAGLDMRDVDGYFCAGDAPGLGSLSMLDYLGLKVRHVDPTEGGGSSYLVHVAHATEAIAAGRCRIYSYSMMRQIAAPYAIAYVTLEEGVTVLPNLIDCDLDRLRIGDPVRLVFKPTGGEEMIPMFTPA